MARTISENKSLETKPLRVLLLEDSQGDVERIVRELQKVGFDVHYDRVEKREDFVRLLEANNYDLILADYRLRGWCGIDALELLPRMKKDVPLLLVTGSLGEEAAVECIKRGVTDYILKDRLFRLPIAVQRALEEKALRESQALAVEALRLREESFRLLFAHNPLPMWVFDAESLQFLQVNEAAVAHYGYSPQEFLRMRIADIRPPEDVPRLLEQLAARQPCLQDAGEWRHRLKDGRIIDVEIHSHALEYAGRRAVLLVAQDITERKQAAGENARLIKAIEQSADGVLITDPSGRIQFANPAVTRITGYIREEVLGHNPRLFKSGRHDRSFYERLWGTILSGEVWQGEITNRRKDGSEYIEEASITSVRDDCGAITHFIATKRDITERKRIEEALRQSEGRYRNLVENATYGIYQATQDGKLLDVNAAMVQMLGYAAEAELLALDLPTKVYRRPEDRTRLIELLKERGRIDGFEVHWKRKDGSPILVRLSCRAVPDEQGKGELFEGMVEDLSERQAMELHLRQIQKFEAIGQLAGGIAHDFNNVLGAILGWAELGQDQTPTGSQVHTHFKKIAEQAERAASLTRQLLAFARRQFLEPQSINLNATVTGLLSLLEKLIGKDIELKTVLAPNLPVVRADPSQIEQVLMNLCLNARDAMPQGGQLLIETRGVEIDEEYCRTHTYALPGLFALLSVSDTGIGMDAETREHIFEPFFTTKGTGKGTGLGLATVYGIVKQHGGIIHVYSELERGSTFRVYLPASEATVAVETPKAKPATRRVPGGTEMILLAEDHDGLRELAREALEGLGYRVLLAADGEEALKLLQAHRNEVALAVLDVVMPKLGGPQAYARMCALAPELPAVFTTGYSAEAASLNTMAGKPRLILQKPYTAAQLACKVREVLDAVGDAVGKSSRSRPTSS